MLLALNANLHKISDVFRRKKNKLKEQRKDEANPDEILQLGFGFWSSRVLLTAVEIELFTKLAAAAAAGSAGMTNEEIVRACGLHERAAPDFTDCLVSLNFLQREGNDVSTALYSNTPETNLFLDKAKPETYVGESLEYGSLKLYRAWTKHPKFLVKEKTEKHNTEIEKCRDWMHSVQNTTKARLLRNKMHGHLTPAQADLSPQRIFHVAFSFWPSRVLLTAIELGLFTALEESVSGCMTKNEIRRSLGLKCRGPVASTFLETLVNCRMLKQNQTLVLPSKKKAVTTYSCTRQTALFLDKDKITYVGGILDMCSRRLFHFWADLPEALRSGMMQNEAKDTGWQMWPELYSVPARLENFMEAMIGISAGNFTTFASRFDFSPYKTFVDIGGATGQLASFVAMENKHLTSLITTDLKPVGPVTKKWIHKWGTQDRVKFLASDFLLEDFPPADVITMGMILHDWNLETKKMLIRKAYNALPPGGAFIAIEAIIDDERRTNTHGLCMSLNMLIEFSADGGFDFTHADFNRWCLEAGFQRTEVMPLLGPSSAVIAYK